MIRPRWSRLLIVAMLASGACSLEWGATADAVRDADRRWTRVYADADYDIAVDTAHIRRHLSRDGAFEVWYRTQHLKPRSRNGRPWDREITLSVLSCDGLMYKIARVDMSEGDKKPISRQRTTSRELDLQSWREVETGTIEESTARAACRLAHAPTIRTLAELRRTRDSSRVSDSR